MSVRKSCYTCKHYENHAICQLANKCIDCSEWEISDVYREAETVPVVTEKSEAVHDYRKCANRCGDCNILSCDECTNFALKRDKKTCSVCSFFKKYESVTDSGIAGKCLESDTNVYKEEVNVCFCKDFKPAHDPVSHPSHYCKGGVECLDAIKAALGDKYEGFLAGNVLKYVYRYPDKNGVEDCKKARFYLEKLIEVLENGR